MTSPVHERVMEFMLLHAEMTGVKTRLCKLFPSDIYNSLGITQEQLDAAITVLRKSRILTGTYGAYNLTLVKKQSKGGKEERKTLTEAEVKVLVFEYAERNGDGILIIQAHRNWRKRAGYEPVL